MIHSLSGGVIRDYENYIYVFVEIEDGADKGVKRWYISPFLKIKVGDRAEVPTGPRTATAKILRVENVTAQTAPFPVKRTAEILRIIT